MPPAPRRLAAALLPAVALACLLLAAGCSSRDHDNPLDPENPETHGRPKVLKTYAGEGSTLLRWDTLDLRDLNAQFLWRASGDGPPALIGALDPDVDAYCDPFLENGTTYTYSLGWRFGESEVVLELPETRARPGGARVWTADVTGGGLLAMTPDGTRVRDEIGAGRSILDLTVDPASGTVWGADFDNGEIYTYNVSEDSTSVLAALGVNTVSFDPILHVLWTGAFFQERIEMRSRDGSVQASYENMGLVEDIDAVPGLGAYAVSRDGEVHWLPYLSQARLVANAVWPVAVAYDAGLDGVWICDRGAGEVLFLPHGQEGVPAEVVFRGLDTAVDLSPDGEGRCWISDRGSRVVRVRRGGGADLSLDLDVRPEGVTVDPVRREVWIAAPREGAVRLLDSEGTELFRWEGSLWPKKVEGAWDPSTGWRCEDEVSGG